MLLSQITTAMLLALAVLGCKPRNGAESVSQELTLDQREVSIEIPDGIMYLDPSSYSRIYDFDKRSIDRAVTQLEAELKKALEEQKKNPKSESRFLAHVKGNIDRDLQFIASNLEGINQGDATLVASELKFAAGKPEITSLEVVPNQPGMIVELKAGSRSAKQLLIAFKYRLKTRGLLPRKYKLEHAMRAEGYIPNSSALAFIEEAQKVFASCIEKADGGENTSENFFHYLKPKLCNFRELNKGDKYFTKIALTITDASKIRRDASPEYNRIWEDDRLVATFVFGKVGNLTPNETVDGGTRAYNDFLARLKTLDTITIQRDDKISNDNHRFTGKVRAGWFTKTKVIDVQVVHVSTVDNISESMAGMIFGDRIGPSDLFVYNGHSGYGSSIQQIEKIIKPDADQFVLFYLNGCQSYTYSKLDNPNFDVILNGRSTYFEDMSTASIATLNGLIKGSTYTQMLKEIPRRSCPAVSGEDVPSVKP